MQYTADSTVSEPAKLLSQDDKREKIVPTPPKEKLEQMRTILELIAAQKAHSSLEDWYMESQLKGLIAAHGGGGLLATHFRNSPLWALQLVYPDHQFLTWRFQRGARGFWKSLANQRRFFDWAATQLSFDPKTEWEKWYSVTCRRIHELGGGSLLVNFYKSSLSRALTSVYRELPWDMSKFSVVSTSYWDDPEHVTQFFDQLGQSIGVKKLEDWYILGNVEVVSNAGGSGMLQSRFKGSVFEALQTAYPHHKWQSWWFTRASKDTWASPPEDAPA